MSAVLKSVIYSD